MFEGTAGGLILVVVSLAAPRNDPLSSGCDRAGCRLREWCPAYLAARSGTPGIGVEVDSEAARACRRIGHTVVVGGAESLPFRSNSFPGVLCKVVIPYTDEHLAIAEIGRILAPGGVALLYLHGLGYSLRYLLRPEMWKRSVYAAKTILNTAAYRLAGRRLPGLLGDTLFQSERRPRRYYLSAGLRLEATIPTRRFVGRPVFIGYVVRK